MRGRTTLVLSLLGAAGCAGFDPQLGTTPFLCGAEDPKCPSGYECQPQTSGQAVCVSTGRTTVEDATSVNCHDDSALEPNDTIQTAYLTPVENREMRVSYAGLSICPGSDKDTYQVGIKGTGRTINATMVYEDGAALAITLFGADGTKLVDGAVTATDTASLMFAAPGIGNYFVQVSSPTGAENNYTLELGTSP
ncbi:MAG TPA: hypothetical protein VGF94_23235 [Kofleriaceae bacterium]|jgi:hypothetical protein